MLAGTASAARRPAQPQHTMVDTDYAGRAAADDFSGYGGGRAPRRQRIKRRGATPVAIHTVDCRPPSVPRSRIGKQAGGPRGGPDRAGVLAVSAQATRSAENTSELKSLMRT